jgi:CheY-like chemotaxis protein
MRVIEGPRESWQISCVSSLAIPGFDGRKNSMFEPSDFASKVASASSRGLSFQLLDRLHQLRLFLVKKARQAWTNLPFRFAAKSEPGERVDSAELNRSFLDNLPGLAWLTDTQGRCCFVNQQTTTTFGLTQEQWWGKPAGEVLPASLAGPGDDRRRTSVHNQPTTQIVVLPDNQRPRYFLLSRFPVRVANETMIGAVALELSDWVTVERSVVAARDELFGYERARLIDRLSSSLAHQLNNTLNAMRLQLSLLRSDQVSWGNNFSPGWFSKQLDDAAFSVQRLQKSSHIEWDRPLMELNLSTVILEAISVVETYKLGDFGRPRTGPRFNLDKVPTGLSPIMGIVPELLHLFVNLFLDADRLMPSDAALRITVKDDDGRVTVTLSGQNRYFSRRSWADLLNPFSSPEIRYPLDPRSSMAESLMVRLGGSVEIIRIRRLVDDFGLRLGFPSVNSYRLLPPKARGKRKACRCLLIIDDDSDNLELMKTVLELRGFSVLTASSGFEALRVLDANRGVDSVVCDLGMPGMNGWDIATEIARISPGTPVYLVTGWADTIPLADARRNLVEAVLSKPVNIEELERFLLAEGKANCFRP